ncbi:hypothetical protein WR25_04037 [Diploscapter pachys]|uniref:Origin recognition complex subunit 4 C-terminal domain-containing protein n=1 Tax=Diploscapter pachys TaxID=2018661 RepID=A0A2A2KM01_9BILA|nr:hypothetical protein WR25_04037 [Diploscapter pachys]
MPSRTRTSTSVDETATILQQMAEALGLIDTVHPHLEEAEKKLLSIADKFMSSGNGASCRVEGLSNTDKVHLQRRLAERCRHRAEIVTVNYDELFTDSNCEERFEKDRNHPRVFFVFNAEHFISSLRQTLLYKLLNGTMLYPWLVVLAVNSQDFYGHLEKRVRSRLSPDRICVSPTTDISTYLSHFYQLLSKDKFPEMFGFLARCSFAKQLNYLYQMNSDFDVLRRCTALMLTELICLEELTTERAESALKFVIEMHVPAVPLKSPFFNILKDLSLRQIAVLMCATRLFKQLESRFDDKAEASQISFRQVFLEYKQMANKSYKLLDVNSDKIIFEEIRRLGSLGLLTIGNKTTNVSFQKISLPVDVYSLSEQFKTLSLPAAVQDFFAHVSAM